MGAHRCCRTGRGPDAHRSAGHGKSTFARFLYQRLQAAGRQTAYLDGDPGQTTLGPPATVTASLGAADEFPPSGLVRRWFIGAVSPIRHMLRLVIGCARLTEAMLQAGVEVVIHDTSGLIDPRCGGDILKWAKIDLLRPSVIFAFQRADELQPILAPLRRRSLRLVELSPSTAIKRRDINRRRQHRARMFRDHFTDARDLAIDWPPAVAVYPAAVPLQPGSLMALENTDGFITFLAITRRTHNDRVILHTPASSLEGSESLRTGDLLVDSNTFQDKTPGRRR